MKIGFAQINTRVGDLRGNRERILDAYQRLCAQGAEIILYPELAVCGYPPRDLLFKSHFVPDIQSSLNVIAAATGPIPAVIGFVERNATPHGRRFFNSAAWCQDGEVKQTARKCLLPTYDVFDEDRYFEPAEEPIIFQHKHLKIGITICEDIWTHSDVPTHRNYAYDPLDKMQGAELDLLLNLSASPWHYGKSNLRSELITRVAIRCQCPVAYCNLVGGNDELIFDGGSMLVSANGEQQGRLAQFTEDLRIVDTEAPIPTETQPLERPEPADIFNALVLGLRDYAHKSGFQKVLLGLSGGIDSALTAVLAVKAFGSENVMGVSLPSKISSQHSRDDAAALAKNLGIDYRTLSIQEMTEAADATLAPLFEGLPRDLTEENLQARARGMLLMALSNKFGYLLLTTGNKSELAVGYCTLYGDMCGGLAVLSDLPKTKVYELCRYINATVPRPIIPENTIAKSPSAELSPGQKDEDTLPPYEILDEILRLYIEEGRSSAEVIAAGFEAATVCDVVRKVDLSEYKRKQAAPGLKITPLAFGIGRRIPIVQHYV